MEKHASHQLGRSQGAAQAGLAFVESRQAQLPAAIIRYHWVSGSPEEVIEALAAYQNEDGGFGHRLEPDIHAPASNPFAARIAMQVLRMLPTEVGGRLRQSLGTWLTTNQAADGDWHFSEETRAGFMQPWFAGWTFPSLNPACCIAGLAESLGLASPRMMTRVANLFAQKASLEGIRSGALYDLLPYVEYSLGVDLPEGFPEAIATRIITLAESGGYDDAGHFFTHALPGSPAITERMPQELIRQQVDRLLSEHQDDGGWPTPYDDAWRVWTTAENLATLARLRT